MSMRPPSTQSATAACSKVETNTVAVLMRPPSSVPMRSARAPPGLRSGRRSVAVTARVPPVAMSMPVVLGKRTIDGDPAPPSEAKLRCRRRPRRASSGWVALRMKLPVPELAKQPAIGSLSGVSLQGGVETDVEEIAGFADRCHGGESISERARMLVSSLSKASRIEPSGPKIDVAARSRGCRA